MKTLGRKVSVILVFALMTACSQTSTKSTGTSSLDPATQALVSFKLTDAPNKSLKSVYVNIDHMEVVLAGKGKAGRLILAQGLGMVDLLTLQNGVTMNLQNIVAPEGIQIQQIRLILKGDGHYAVKADDSICELKTPSAEKSGVKIILTNKVQFEAGHEYSIVVDFDALKSVVIQGNGNCLLKPVLKLKSAFKKPYVEDDDDDEAEDNMCLLSKSSASKHEGEHDDDDGDIDSDDQNENSDATEVGENSDDDDNDNDESEQSEDSNDVKLVTSPCPAPTPAPNIDNGTTSTTGDSVTDPAASTDPAANTDPNANTSGEELVVNPDQNDTTTSDGWDTYVEVIDGVTPVVTQDQLGQLL